MVVETSIKRSKRDGNLTFALEVNRVYWHCTISERVQNTPPLLCTHRTKVLDCTIDKWVSNSNVSVGRMCARLERAVSKNGQLRLDEQRTKSREQSIVIKNSRTGLKDRIADTI